MAAGDKKFGGKIVLDGAAEYRAALNEITASQRTLNKEMELAKSEFKATGDAQKYYEEKTRLLNAQMDNQKKKLETAQKALKELSDKGVDKNSDLWRKWNNTLIETQTKMNNLQAELNTTSDAMKETAEAAEQVTEATEQVTEATERATQETADYSETLKSIDKGVKFGNILNGLRVIKDAVGGVISTAYRMGKVLFMSQISGGDWAREIMMGAAAADLSVEEYQARQYAQALSGIEYNAIDEGILELGKRLGSTGEDAVALYAELNKLGIVSRETELQARNAEETFWEVVDALNAIGDADSRNATALRIFGDPYKNLRALFEYGGSEYLKLAEEGKAFATVTEESVNVLADMDSTFEQVKATAKATWRDVQAEIAPGFAVISEAFADTLREFNEFLDSSEGKAKVEEWNKTVSDFADMIKEADFKTGLEYVEGKLTKIASAFKTIGGTWQAVRDSWNFYETLFEEGPQAAITQMTKSKTGENIASAVTFDDYLWQKNQKFIKEITQQPEEPTAKKATENEVSVFTFDPNGGFNMKKQVQQINTATESFEKLLSLLKTIQGADLSYLADQMAIAQLEKQYSEVFKNQNIANAWQSTIDRIDSGEIANNLEAEYAMNELIEVIQSAIEKINNTAQSGGSSAISAFNAAIEKGTADTKGTLKSGITAAFSGFDSVFSSMGTAHGAAYVNALSAQMSRISSMLSLSPSYAYGGSFYNPSQSAYASPTSTANVSLYVGREKFGQLTTPIINAQMGTDLQAIR